MDNSHTSPQTGAMFAINMRVSKEADLHIPLMSSTMNLPLLDFQKSP